MSGTGETTADFAGEAREFRIRLGEIRRIEAKCETGIGEVCRRLARAVTVQRATEGKDLLLALSTGIEIHAEDVRSVIYEGLSGAQKLSSAEITRIVRCEIDERGLRGLMDNAPTALLVLIGSQETPDAGESQAGESPATQPSPSTSPTSTEPAPPSD